MYALSLTLWAALFGGAPSAEVAAETPSQSATDQRTLRGQLTLGPGFDGRLLVQESSGEAVASVELRPDQSAQLNLPPGNYRLVEPDGNEVELVLDGSHHALRKGPIEVLPPPTSSPAASATSRDATPTVTTGVGTREPRVDPPGAAAASFVVPGLGQMLNRRPATGAGILLGTVGLGVASALASRPPLDPTRLDFANEAIRLGGYGLSTAALQLLWAAQWMHAYRDARGTGVTPRVDHRLALELTRNFSLATGPSEGSLQFLRAWSLSLLGQPFERVQLGVSDVSVHANGTGAGQTLALGVRAGYRVYQREAVWMNVGGGVLGQLDLRRNPLYGVADAGAQARRSVAGSATFYAQYDLRIFIIDRWSLNLMPRFYLPVGTRRFAGGRAVPSLAPSFELGTGVGVLF